MSGEEVQEVDKFKYLGLVVRGDGNKGGEEVPHRKTEGRKVWETRVKSCKNMIYKEIKWMLYERMVITTVVGWF